MCTVIFNIYLYLLFYSSGLFLAKKTQIVTKYALAIHTKNALPFFLLQN